VHGSAGWLDRWGHARKPDTVCPLSSLLGDELPLAHDRASAAVKGRAEPRDAMNPVERGISAAQSYS